MNRNTKKICLAVAAVAITIPMMAVDHADTQEVRYTDMSGRDRFTTAVNIARKGWPEGADTVILVNSEAVADSLSVAPLASEMKAPVLLTGHSVLNNDTYNEIKALNAKNIVIIGGANSVSPSIEQGLMNEGLKVERITGNSRIETSLNIARKLQQISGRNFDSAFVVNGMKGLPDAAGIGSVAAKMKSPILFTDANGAGTISTELRGMNIQEAYLIGGKSSLPSSFDSVTSDVERISGRDRNATNLAIINKFFNNYDTVYIANDGSKSPSALIDSVLINAGIISSNNGGNSDLKEGPVMLSNYRLGLGYNQMRSLYGNSRLEDIIQVSGSDFMKGKIANFMEFTRNRLNPQAVEGFNKMLSYENVNISYKLKNGTRKVLDSRAILPMIICNERNGFNVDFDRSMVQGFVSGIDVNGYRDGSKVDYAYWENNNVIINRKGALMVVDVPKETDRLMKLLKEDKSFSNITPYYKSADINSKGQPLGTRYVEISLSNQNMKLWDNGRVILETPVVTGNPNTGMATPPGIFKVKSKSRNVVLRGPGYASPVQYWVPFNGSIGIHDAYWQPVYGGNRYLYAGSHGCINTPLKKVAELYNMISVGTPVVVVR